MVRGLLRPGPSRPRLPESTENARRGEYDSREPLGRLMLPGMHNQVDGILEARRVARNLPAPPRPTVQTHGDSGEQDQPAAQPVQTRPSVIDDVVAGRDIQDRRQSHSDGPPDRGPEGHTRHSTSRSGSSCDNSRENNNGGAETTTASSGTHNNTNEDDNSSDAVSLESADREQLNRQGGPSSTNTNIAPVSAPDDQIVAAYYEETLPIYTRYPEPTLPLSPANVLHQTGVFCANYDPQAQISRTALLSDYLCGACWVHFVLWRSNQAIDI